MTEWVVFKVVGDELRGGTIIEARTRRAAITRLADAPGEWTAIARRELLVVAVQVETVAEISATVGKAWSR